MKSKVRMLSSAMTWPSNMARQKKSLSASDATISKWKPNVEGSLCSSADAISASRQGARSEPVEEYIKRLKRLEEMAYEFQGVEKAYAMQAGREIRVVVLPEVVDDTGLSILPAT